MPPSPGGASGGYAPEVPRREVPVHQLILDRPGAVFEMMEEEGRRMEEGRLNEGFSCEDFLPELNSSSALFVSLWILFKCAFNCAQTTSIEFILGHLHNRDK